MKKRLVISSGITILLFIIFLTVALFLIASFEPTPDKEISEEPVRRIAPHEIPEAFIPVYQDAEEAYDVPWRLLAAVHRVETIFSTMDPLISPAGAEGHLQFMPCTWTGWSHPTCGELGLGEIDDAEKTDPAAISRYGGYGVDATDNGVADPFDLHDAIFSAANYLAIAGAAEGRLEEAVFDYNRADWYVSEVLHFYSIYNQGYNIIDLEEEGIDTQHTP